MSLFEYRAINPEGKKVKGKINAVNPVDLENKVKELSYILVDYKIQKVKKKGWGKKK